MILKDISFPEPQKNLLFDEVLFNLAEKDSGGEVLRFWESPIDFIVLGRIGKEEEDVRPNSNIPVLRRASGGGTVVQGKGCLNFTFVIAKSRTPEMNDIKKSYAAILNFVTTALKEQNISAVFFPISDLALPDGRKFSGNAQKRGKNFILHHGTVLYNFDLNKIERYLEIPQQMPEYRQGRKHLDFVTNINVDIARFKKSLATQLNCTKKENQLSDRERDALDEVIAKCR